MVLLRAPNVEENIGEGLDRVSVPAPGGRLVTGIWRGGGAGESQDLSVL